MTNYFMQMHQCGFPNCTQQFTNQYDLIAHIEYTHIPVIEDDVKRKRMVQESNDIPVTPTPNLPLSYYSRVFRTAYRPNPIKPEPLKVSFNHYKRRAMKEKMQSNIFAARILREMMAKQGRHISLDESEKKAMEIDFNECGPDDPEVRFQCAIVDCNKRYKSMFALRVHMKISHNVVVSEEAKSLTNYASEDVKPNLSLLQQSMHQFNSDKNAMSAGPSSLPTSDPGTPLSQGSPRPGGTPNFGNPATNQTSMKCSCCNKRYKTPGGLSNHMMQTHQKISDVQDVPSQMVVEQLISQVRMQRHQQEQSSSESSSQKNLPIATSSQTVANSMSRSRTFSVSSQQSNRFSQQHYPVNLDNQPSTGQVLQMQMQHQKRLKQMQEMKNIQEQQAAQAGALHHSAIGMQQGQHSSAQIGQPAGQNQQQMNQQQQPHQAVQSQQQQLHNKMAVQRSQQQSPYPQQMQQVAQHSPHPYQQYPQPSPQFPQYQQASPAPQQHQQQSNIPQPAPAQPQRSPAPLSQPLPPLSSVSHQQRPSMHQQAQSNSGPIQFSPPDSQDFNTVSSPPSNQQGPSQQPPQYHQ